MLMFRKELSNFDEIIEDLRRLSEAHEISIRNKGGKWELSTVHFDKREADPTLYIGLKKNDIQYLYDLILDSKRIENMDASALHLSRLLYDKLRIE